MSSDSSSIRVLFVCSGNICRSPTAEGLFRYLAPALAPSLALEADSAGTHGFHAGEAPDSRARAALQRLRIGIGGLRARRVRERDFAHFDHIVALDRGHLSEISGLKPPRARARLSLLLDFAPGSGARDVPDPYYGDSIDFDHALGLIETGVRGLLTHLRGGRCGGRA